ncbi:TetR/AcrR family transcriptional regulator C-terminal domain-containing protein [Amycolatopsis sp. NBC_01488]|uniref:TetR/AcrR family transcriptional regulator n=1 Tax=Amycolatopsis sp. NBC_01488 TaxID=2903563 RepID=UPI002E2D2D4D|nr:TetR/AcrR family transcriptional regulator C-terminal domain-containing protein [Amycolatopsis sp. NBC_01488]
MPPRTRRRTEALSRERIIEAAIELLDTSGEAGLTFRTLTEHLATGAGAIYWHVANKGELLNAATDGVLAAALTVGSADSPRDEVRAVALGLFDAIDHHPWLATQLALQLSRGSVTPRIFEAVGRPVHALGVPEGHRFTTTSALVSYILGAAGQNAANARIAIPHANRTEFLDAVASAWEDLDPEEYPVTRSMAAELRGHDDREQFLAGVDLILAGITAAHRPGEPS